MHLKTFSTYVFHDCRLDILSNVIAAATTNVG